MKYLLIYSVYLTLLLSLSFSLSIAFSHTFQQPCPSATLLDSTRPWPTWKCRPCSPSKPIGPFRTALCLRTSVHPSVGALRTGTGVLVRTSRSSRMHSGVLGSRCPTRGLLTCKVSTLQCLSRVTLAGGSTTR